MGTVNPVAQVPLTVKPRKTCYEELPLLAVRKGQCLTENGVIGDVDKIDWRKLRPVVVVGINLAHLVAGLDQRYRDDPSWQWKARDSQMEVGTVAVHQRTIVDFFGFTGGATGSNRYHRCLDAYMFYSNTFTLTEETTETLQGLMTWAKQIRDYCKSENIPLRPTASAIAAGYLRDPRFYPHPRRKVPRQTNARVRETLPGNHYQLCVTTPTERTWNAIEIDQKRAHHYHAEHTPLPDANTLFAFGDFEDLQHVTAQSPHNDFLGLYYMRLRLPGGGHSHHDLSPIRTQGRGSGSSGFFVYSNELPMLYDLGYECMGVIAGWGSRVRDKGVRSYARHCQSQLDKHNNAAWLKPILLTTYGLLAVKPRVPSAVFRRAKAGEPYVMLAGGQRTLHGLLVSHTNGREIEPGIANVLHRGMIEASTRVESLGLAEYLIGKGVNVLHVYADAVIVEDDPDNPVPWLPDPWRIKQRLTDYKPINPQAYISLEQDRIPGHGADRETIMARRKRSTPGQGQLPVKPRYEALTGRRLGEAEQLALGLEVQHI